MTVSPRHGGWIEVIAGSMFSGKSEELIRRLRRAEIARQKVAIFKPGLDDRFSEEEIVSHSQQRIQSTPVAAAKDILVRGENAEVIGIDEAQFFDSEILDVVRTLAGNGKRVVIAGLDKDYRGKPFGPMPELMVEAEYLTKMRAICIQCGEPAGFTQRLGEDEHQILIGEANLYEARCRQCFVPHPVPFNKEGATPL